MSVMAMKQENERFKRAVIISISVHVALFVFLIVSPYLPKPKRRGMIHYVNIYSLPGGGGGGGEAARLETSTEEVTETPAPPRETLRDLTTPPKAEELPASTLRHPVENPKKEKAPPAEKKAVIEKQQPTTKTASPASKESGSSEGSGSGSGIKFGTGSGSGGGGGPESLSQIGLSNFRYPYYIRHIENRLSSNWVKSYTGPEKLYTEVIFRIYRNGEVGGLKVESSCGVASLDRTAVRAIYSSSAFAPLPQGYQYDYLEIQLIFEH